MAMTSDADETDSLDFKMLLHQLREVVQEDGLTQREAHIVERFEMVVDRYSHRVGLRIALETLIKSGVNRYTTTKAKDAGMIVVSLDGRVQDIVPAEHRHEIDRDPQMNAIAA